MGAGGGVVGKGDVGVELGCEEGEGFGDGVCFGVVRGVAAGGVEELVGFPRPATDTFFVGALVFFRTGA